MAQIQFSLIKKINIGHPEHSLYPQPLRPITSYFRLTHLPNPLQSKCHVCVTPKMKVFVVLLVCGLQPSTNVTKNSALGVAGVLDPPLELYKVF